MRLRRSNRRGMSLVHGAATERCEIDQALDDLAPQLVGELFRAPEIEPALPGTVSTLHLSIAGNAVMFTNMPIGLLA